MDIEFLRVYYSHGSSSILQKTILIKANYLVLARGCTVDDVGSTSKEEN